MTPQIDVLIPTSRRPERLQNLVWQIRSVLNQNVHVRVTVAMSGPWPDLEKCLTDDEKWCMRFVVNAPDGNIGNPAVNYCIETLDWADWYYQTGDDDALLPWGLRHLYEATSDVSMVIGQALCVSKRNHHDITAYKVGHMIALGKVSGVCALFKMPDVKKLPKPFWNPDSKVSDFELIEKMAKDYKYRIVPNAVSILALV